MRYDVDPDTGCWIWRGALTTGGYSSVSVGGRVGMGTVVPCPKCGGGR